MATLGTVYDAEPAVRGVDDIIADPADPVKERRPGPKARSKWLCGSVNDTAEQVIAAVFDQADARDPGHRRTWVVLVDGARHQLDLIRAEAARRNVTVHIVIDIIHILDYLWGVAHCLHPARDGAAEAWVAGQARTILAGGSEQAAASISAPADAVGLRPGSHKGIDDAVGYLKNKAAYQRYDTALAEGFPIATGIIAGACRHLTVD